MADEYYNNKIVTTDGDVLMDVTQDTATPETVLEGETFHRASGAPATGTYRPSDEIESRLRATVGHSSKNLLQITADTRTIKGVTFTVDKQAGTITASGTATSDAQLDFQGSSPKSVSTIKNGLIYSCEGTSSNLVCAISYYNDSGAWISEQRATASGTIISIPSNANSYKFWVRKRPAAESETFIFKPMLRDGSISDDTFEPYQEPTDSLIETKARAYLTSTIGHVCKNLLDLTKYVVSSSITNIIVNPETGSVSANASGSWKSIYFIDENIQFENGKTYVVSCTNNVVNASGRLAIRNRGTNIIYKDVSFKTLGVKSITFTPNITDFPNGWTISLFITNASGADGNIDISDLMLREASIADDTFEPYRIPTDEAKQDKPVVLYDAGESSVGEYYVTGLSGFTQYSELHITLFAPTNGDYSDSGFTYTIIHPIVFPDTPDRQATCFECRVVVVESGTVKYKQIGLIVFVANANISIHEFDEDGNVITIPSNHYIYIKRIVGIPK